MINESLKNAFKKMWENNLNLLDISKSDLDSHIDDSNPHPHLTPSSIGAAYYDHNHYYAGSSYAGGPADYLKVQSDNEINFRGLKTQTSVYFNYKDADTNKVATDNLITKYYFDNKSGSTTGVTLYAENFSGTAAKATALTTSAGSATQPVYFSSGKPVACTYTLGKSVPSDAKFTDTTYTSLKNPYALTIQGNGTTLTNGIYDGSAAKTVNITPASIGAATSSHTHNYAGSSSVGGSATSAVKLDSSAGSATNPIYFSNGKPAACTYTLGKSVPSDAKFTDTTYNNATTSIDGLMSSSDKTKLNGIAAGATKTIVDSALSSTSTNPVQNKVIYGAISSKADLNTSGKVLSSQLPSYVDDVLEYSAKSNFPSTGESGKIYVDTATNLTYRWSGSAYVEISQSLALGETSSTAYRGDRGKIAYDHSQISHAPSNAEVNQNAFSNVKVGSTTISADSKTDILELVAGTNVTLTPDATNDKVTITTKDTKNTAGSTDTSSKIFLIGATSQAANPQTYSHNTAYVGTDGCLYSNNTKVSVNGHTHNYITISDTRNDNPSPNSASFIKYALSADFKYVNKINSPSGFSGNYCGLINFAPWGETSGGNGYQIAVGYNTNAHPRLAVRSADLSATSWGSWYKIYTSDDKPTPSDIGAAASSHTHSASNITAGTLGGSVVANATAVGTLTTKQLRNITISTADPKSSDGGNGDVWIKYGSTQSNCPFPVGGVYISIASTNPSSIWAGTTWEQFAKGKTLVGLDTSDSDFNTSGQTGGKKTHTLTPDEIPAHGHGMAHTHSYTGPNTASWKVGTGKAHKWCTSAGGKTSGGASKTTTDNAGGGLAHNNLQPYIVVYMWKRVS